MVNSDCLCSSLSPESKSNSLPPGPVLSKSTGEYAASSIQDWHLCLKDDFVAVPDIENFTCLFGVYDGDGGAEVAPLCVRQFHIELHDHPDHENNLMTAMRSVFFRMDELLQQSDELKELIKPHDWIQFLKTGVCSNLWPFTQKARTLSTDHKPNHQKMKQRIQRSGRLVTRDQAAVLTGGQFQGYWLAVHQMNGILAVSKVIGDFAFKQNKDLPPEEQSVTCDAQTIILDISNDMEFLVTGNDGIWKANDPMAASNSHSLGPLLLKSTGGENVTIEYAASSMQDWRLCLKDDFAAVPDLDDLTSFFGVYYDRGGAEVAPLCARQFDTDLCNHSDCENNYMNAMRSVFSRMDELLQQSDEWKELIKTHGGDWNLFLRTGVCANHWPFTQKARAISTVHKPNHQSKKQRIQRAEGLVTRDKAAVLTGGQCQGYCLGVRQMNGILAVSKVTGDFAFKQNKDLTPEEQSATCDPEAIMLDISDDMEFLVTGSDSICWAVRSIGWSLLRLELLQSSKPFVYFYDVIFTRASFRKPKSTGEYAASSMRDWHLCLKDDDEDLVGDKDDSGSPTDDSDEDKSDAIGSGGERKVMHLGKWRTLLIAIWIVSLVSSFPCAEAHGNDVCSIKKIHSYVLPRETCPVVHVLAPHWIHSKREKLLTLHLDLRPPQVQYLSYIHVGFLLVLASCLTPWYYIKDKSVNTSYTILLWEIKLIYIWACNLISSIIYHFCWIVFDLVLHYKDTEVKRTVWQIIYQNLSIALTYIILLLMLAYPQRVAILAYLHTRRATQMLLCLLLCSALWFWLSVVFHVRAVGILACMVMIPMYITRWITAKGFKRIPFMLKVGGLFGPFIIHVGGEHPLHDLANKAGILCRIVELILFCCPWLYCWLSRAIKRVLLSVKTFIGS